VNQTSFTYPLDSVEFDSVTTGAFGDIEVGMTVLFGSSAGDDDLGRQRIRAAADSNTVNIGRSSQGVKDGEVNLSDDAYITVLEDYRLWAKIPYIDSDGNMFKDSSLALGTNGTQPPPVANAGPWKAGKVSAGVLTADFDGTNSFAVASGASISSYAWDFGSGATPASSSASTVSGVTFPAGERWIKLTVTDSNAKTHTARALIVAIDDDTFPAITAFRVTSDMLNRQGHTMAFELISDALVSTYPDGTAVIYWEEEFYGGTTAKLAGYSDREEIKFIGWIDTESSSISVDINRGRIPNQTIQCIDPAGRLRKLPSFRQVVERNPSADEWTELAGLNMDRFMWYLMHWHSTVLEVTDWDWSGTGETYLFPRLQSDGGDLFDQVNARAKAIAHNFGCDQQGRLITQPDPMLQASADRTAVEIVDLDESDWLRINVSRNRHPKVHWLRGAALEAHATNFTPRFCIAPGSAPGQGVDARDQNYQIVDDQDELNAREGNRYARQNSEIQNLDLMLAHPGDAGIVPALMEWVEVTLPAAFAAQRGYSFTNARFLPIQVSINHDNDRGAKRATVTLEFETEGQPAATVIPPVGTNIPTWKNKFPTVTPPTPVAPVVEIPSGYATIAAFNSDGYIYLTDNFDEATPEWTRVDMTSGWEVGEIFLKMEVDPGSPFNLGTGQEANCWIITQWSIYYITDVFDKGSGRSIASQHDFNVQGGSYIERSIHAQRSTAGKCVVAYHNRDHGTYPGTWVSWTDDRGATWNDVQVTAENKAAVNNFPGVHVSYKVDGLVYTSGFTDTVNRVALYKSEDLGATWAELIEYGFVAVFLALDIHCPPDAPSGNPTDSLMFHNLQLAAGQLTLRYYDVDTAAGEDISPLAFNAGKWGGRWTIHSYPLDGDIMVIHTTRLSDDKSILWTSIDGGDSWTNKQEYPTGSPQARHAGISGDDPDVAYICGTEGLIEYTDDFFATVQDKNGNIDVDFPGRGEFHFLMGG
jgi:hypothetical protein